MLTHTHNETIPLPPLNTATPRDYRIMSGHKGDYMARYDFNERSGWIVGPKKAVINWLNLKGE